MNNLQVQPDRQVSGFIRQVRAACAWVLFGVKQRSNTARRVMSRSEIAEALARHVEYYRIKLTEAETAAILNSKIYNTRDFQNTVLRISLGIK